MNLLFLSQVLPFPLDAGPKVRSYYVLRYLSQYHRVTLLALTRPGDSPEAVAHLQPFCHRVRTILLHRSPGRDAVDLTRSLIHPKPFLVLRDDLAPVQDAVKEIVHTEEIDAVHADQLSMAHHALRVEGLPRVFDAHNAVWTLVERLAQNEPNPFKRLLLTREARKMKVHEAYVCAAFDNTVTVTEQDRAALTFSTPAPRAPLLTIPICIDPQESSPLPFQPEARDVVCVGGMFYPPNVDGVIWFAREALPLIWQRRPDTRFMIVGARPAPGLRALAAAEARIVVTGYVPDTAEYLQRAGVFVVPLRSGGGMRVKILDAWARALPIVTTSIGCEGIDASNRENLILGDTPRELAEGVLDLLQDRALAQTISAKGRAHVTSLYNWRQRYKAFDAIYPH